jgi:hypothetical protein
VNCFGYLFEYIEFNQYPKRFAGSKKAGTASPPSLPEMLR